MRIFLERLLARVAAFVAAGIGFSAALAIGGGELIMVKLKF